MTKKTQSLNYKI